MADLVVTQQFCGPPNSGNGGYCCGIFAKAIDGPATAMLKARIPLDVGLRLEVGDQITELFDNEGNLIGAGRMAARTDLPQVPAAPSLDQAIAAEARHVGHTGRYHPICFTCGPERVEGEGLRIFPGRLKAQRPDIRPAHGRHMPISPILMGSFRWMSSGAPWTAPASSPGW